MLYKEPNGLQIRVTLREIEPAIWRQLVVPWTWHLEQLHLAIQAPFNW
jgi:Plasmid pRiA4b ORF-3-like protein